MDRIERWCAKAIQQTADTGTDPTKYACLAHRVGGTHLVTRQHVGPEHLLRKGWSTFVETLYCSGDVKAFEQYKPGLDDFRDRFPQAFPKAGFSGPEPYRQLEILQALEGHTLPEDRLYLDPDPEKDGYVLAGESVIWRSPSLWHWGGFRIPWLTWLAVITVVVNVLRWLFSDWPDWIVDRIFGNLEGILSTIIVDLLIGMGPGILLAVLVLSHIIDWSRGRLTLTNRALYFRGWFVSKHIPLEGIHEILDRKRAVLVRLPPDEDRQFWMRGCHARWLTRVMRALTVERRSESGQPAPAQEAAQDRQPHT